MLGGPSEIHPEAGLLVWRSAVDPALARDFAAETCEWLDGIRPDWLSPNETYFKGMLADEVCRSGRLATAQILGVLGTTTAEYGVNFIHRPPGSSDGFHQDHCYESVDVIHGDDGSAVDVAPFATSAKEAERGSLIIIHFSAGDLVRHFNATAFHQGRNPTDAPQVNAAIRKLPSFEERFGPSPYRRVA
jgi:hypothetical protein